MQHISRKRFLQYSAALSAAGLISSFRAVKRQPMLLSFSTLGCPDWSLQQIIDFAAGHGYRGVEMRGLQRQMDLTKVREFSTAAAITETVNRFSARGLKLVDLGSSCNLHIGDEVKRKENLDEAKRFIDLARATGCPYVRVFPNNLPKDEEKQEVLGRIIRGLKELGDYAKGTGVKVLMETHGDLVHSEHLSAVMLAVNHPQTGLVWDIANMWTITKEPPRQVYAIIKDWICHTHVKDARFVNGELKYVFMGQGEVPIFEAIDLLVSKDYKGYYSFEWEKMWHPELPAPEQALADFPIAMAKYFDNV